MGSWRPPTYFLWPAPILGFCTSCRKVQTTNGWESVPTNEMQQLFRQNIEWMEQTCNTCKNIVPSASTEANPAPTLTLVAAS